jgi:hypothetical protein
VEALSLCGNRRFLCFEWCRSWPQRSYRLSHTRGSDGKFLLATSLDGSVVCMEFDSAELGPMLPAAVQVCVTAAWVVRGQSQDG